MADLLAIEDALAAIAAEVRPLATETVALTAAAGRVLGEPLTAALDLPPFTNSAMDGYAVRAADGLGPLRVIGESAAGAPFAGIVGTGEAVVISTGAVLADGADAVVPIEVVKVTAGGDWIDLERPVRARANVRARGSDAHAGDEILRAGTALEPVQLGAAAAVGANELVCARRPRVAIVATGTELRAPGSALGPGQIYDSNGLMLAAAVTRAGGLPTVIAAAADTEDAHRQAFERGLQFDVMLTAGGVSVGRHDLVRGVQRSLGVQERFWRIAMRPGKPLSFGVRDRADGSGRTLLFGLPGNPVSVVVCFELFVAPALRALQGALNPGPRFRTVRLGADTQRNPERDDLIRARLNEDGTVALPLAGQQSHQIATSSQADGVVRIPLGSGLLAQGSSVAFLTL